jgi:DNA-binding NtrC family response regulator
MFQVTMSSPGILLVDDDGPFRSAVSRMLARQGYSVLQTAGSSQALETLSIEPPFRIILCDIEMPGMRGTDLAREITRVSPQTSIILMTGGSSGRSEAPEGVPILRKPFPKAQLFSAVEAALARSAHVSSIEKICDDRRAAL